MENSKISREEALKAVQTLIKYIGDDPEREGLIETPNRVIKAFDEYYGGYKINPQTHLKKTFSAGLETYKEMVIVKDIKVFSHCEHHMVPFYGVAHIGYIPNEKIVGLSKLARVVDGFAKRLQTQEKLTIQVAESIQNELDPIGVGVVIEAVHECMVSRGIGSTNSKTITSRLLGVMNDQKETRAEFLSLIES
ncbi:MAG: GTP cyclohydrolase I FolE [Pseudomonadota bacterium]|nr:GTP cyclohydrolase I FolE [Pseudomonadota bacterium]